MSERPGPSLPGNSTQLAAVAVATALLFALAAWYVRPWLHGLVYVLYTTPVFVLALLVAGAIAAVGLRRAGVSATLNVLGPVVVALFVGGAMLSGLVAGATLGTQTMDDVRTVDGLDASDPENPRIVTRAVADRYASNTLNFPQYRITGSDVTVYNDTLHWSYALSPDGLYNHFTKRQHGTVMVDMTEQNTEIKTFEGDLTKGIGTAHYNNYKWALLKRGEYLVDYQDPFMVVHEGEQHIAVPYTKPNFHFAPLPHTTPEWGGVALVDSDGTITDLSPAEARESEVLGDQRLYPFDLARQRVAATKYRNGILNTFTAHEDEIEVAPVPGEGNEQPFLLRTEEGPEYVVAVEPYGEAQGLREIWTVDGRTGEYERYAPNQSLFGPRKAADYVRQAARTTDWDRFDPSEPIPVVVDDRLYWQVRVVPSDNSGISYIAFVDAQTSDVTEVETTPQVVAFMEGRQPRPGDGAGDEGAGEARRPQMIVQRVAPNGTVLSEMEVYGNESVRIQRGNATAAP